MTKTMTKPDSNTAVDYKVASSHLGKLAKFSYLYDTYDNGDYPRFNNYGDDANQAHELLERRLGKTMIRMIHEGEFYYNAGMGWATNYGSAYVDMITIDPLGCIREF